MIVYLLLVIPVVTIAFLIYKFRQHLTWWEVSIQLGASILLIVLSKFTIEKINITDTEYWGSSVVKVEYYEPWDEWINQTCTRQVACGTDSKGNTTYCTEFYDCSHSEYHSAHWQALITDYSGQLKEIDISEELYHHIAHKFMNSEFVELDRDYYTKDGDKYVSTWPQNFETHHFMATEHMYDNKVQVAKSVFNFPTVSEEQIKQYALLPYPEVDNNYDLPTVLGYKVSNLAAAEKKLKYLNGTLGPTKKVRVWVLLFNKQPRQAALLQEALWKRGNKNELVICVGLNKAEDISWSYVFSWTEKEAIKVETRKFLSAQKKLDLVALADFLQPEIESKWIRKNFADFDYLTIDPPLWAIIVSSIIQIIFNVLYGIWIVKNEYE